MRAIARPGIIVLLALVAAVLWPTPEAAQGAFPGANGKMAFHSDRDGNGEIYVMNADGSLQTNVTNDSFHDSLPAWSPDGSKIAFSSNRTPAGIYIMDADGAGVTFLTEGYGPPAWSPDGLRIAYTHIEGASQRYIWVVDADGGGEPQELTNTGADERPAWSPDGTQIAFHSDRDGNGEIYVMDADGSNQANRTNNVRSDASPAWSPDSSTIAFSSTRHFEGCPSMCSQIWVMNADGSAVQRVSDGSGNDIEPAWSPDGSKIAFVRHLTSPNGEIYVMDAGGGDVTRLTDDPADDRVPDWQALVAPEPVTPPVIPCPITNFPFPGPGCDNFDSRWAVDVLFTNPPIGGLACAGVGPTQVVRYQDPFAPTDTDVDTLRDFETEIVFMQLQGTCEPGSLAFTVRESPTLDSAGLVEEQPVAKGGDGPGGDFFPANSFFDVFFEVDTPVGTLHNNDPLRMECKVSAIPPVGCTYVPQVADIDLFDEAEKLVGVLTHGSHEPHAVDVDFDGCADDQENGPNEALGGQRDFLNFWDYADMPDPNATPQRDRVIRSDDILRVVERYRNDDDNDRDGVADKPINRNSDPLSPPPKTGYHPAYDRGGVIGPNPWNLGPPDGYIRSADILAVVQQYRHDCA